MTTLEDNAGNLAGALFAPFTELGSRIRHARLFHPVGTVLRGRAEPLLTHHAHAALGVRLSGSVWVRFSGAWWKRRQWLDVLGCAIRFTEPEGNGRKPLPSDQDVLLATIRNPLSLPFSPFTTNVSDYLANDYFGVSPFVSNGGPRIKLRLRPERREPAIAAPRAERLRHAVEARPIQLTLEARADVLGARYEPFLELILSRIVPVDDPRLAFDPFRTGRGLEPSGFLQHARILAYRASRQGRADTRDR